MRIGIMLRAFEERGGVGVYTRNVTRHLLKAAPQHDFFLYLGRAEDLGNVRHRMMYVEKNKTREGQLWN